MQDKRESASILALHDERQLSRTSHCRLLIGFCFLDCSHRHIEVFAVQHPAELLSQSAFDILELQAEVCNKKTSLHLAEWIAILEEDFAAGVNNLLSLELVIKLRSWPPLDGRGCGPALEQ